MAAHLFNESGQMQEVDIPDIFDVLVRQIFETVSCRQFHQR